MLDVALLGTGGMLPLPGRFLSSAMLRFQGGLILIDCGEGTQVSLNMLGWGYKQIGLICLTHFHADHVSGLPGMLLTIGNSGRTEPLLVVGPLGTQNVVERLRVIAPELPYEIYFREYKSERVSFLYHGLSISMLPVDHRVPCFAYRFYIARQGKFDVERARALNIPVQYWNALQKGQAIELDNRIVHPSDVLGNARKGILLTYTTDLRPSDAVVEFARGSDLFICEGNYADNEKRDKAIQKKHCLFSEAADMAKRAGVRELWLTHFSPSLPNPHKYIDTAQEIYANSIGGIDRMTKTLRFSE